MKKTELYQVRLEEIYESLSSTPQSAEELAGEVFRAYLRLRSDPHVGQFYRIDVGRHWYRIPLDPIWIHGQRVRFWIYYEKIHVPNGELAVRLVWIAEEPLLAP
ncbi:MAG TPA: hypothetical protein PLO61_10075 [Fimbriimonadaceae bacterium]|nr:hypothetical protein [Fimbriimonadaceae bacterium]HRJ33948.1 hypothetical protein [Fimbriimonadaceae bacterium]